MRGRPHLLPVLVAGTILAGISPPEPEAVAAPVRSLVVLTINTRHALGTDGVSTRRGSPA